MKQPDIKTALRIYYTCSELGTAEIRELFSVGNTAAAKYKRIVKKKMAEKGQRSFYPNMVNTETAFEVWGINVEALEKKLKKLQALKLEVGI